MNDRKIILGVIVMINLGTTVNATPILQSRRLCYLINQIVLLISGVSA